MNKTKSFWQLMILMLTVTVFSAQAQVLTARPERGMSGNGGYQASDLDAISLQTGSLSLQIPLASLPAIAGGKLSYTLTASYNSKLWDAHRREVEGQTQTPGCQPRYSTQEVWQAEGGAGWRIGGQYEIFYRDAHDDYDYLYPSSQQCYGYEFYHMQGRFFRPMLRLPDGSEHELRIYGYFPTYSSQGMRDHLKGYYVQPGGYQNYPTFNAPVRMYTIDGTYITVIVNPASYAVSSTIYLKDGTRIENSADGQRIKDTNGNSILKGWRLINGGATYESFVKDEQTGREIKWSGTTYNNQSATKVEYQTVGGAWQSVFVVWGETTVQGKIYGQMAWNPNGGGGDYLIDGTCFVQTILPATPFNVVREIILPPTEPNVQPQKYTFGYNSDATEQTTLTSPRWTCTYWEPYPDYTRTASIGWGELSNITTPNGAQIKYNYSHDGIHVFNAMSEYDVDEVLRNLVTSKVVTHDGTTDTWTYEITNMGGNFSSGGKVTNPDGTWHSESYNPTNIAISGNASTDGKGGLLIHTSESGKVTTEKSWTLLGGSVVAIGAPTQSVGVNAVVDTEYTTLRDDSGARVKMSARKFYYDYNGDPIQIVEYDWFDPSTVTYTNNNMQYGMPTGVPSGATVLRVTGSSYYNQAYNASSSTAYHQRNLGASSVILGKLQEKTVGNGTTNQSVTRFSYDGQPYGTAPTVGNLTKLSAWDNVISQWADSLMGYDSYGNVTSRTDAKGNVTYIYYADATHAMPTSTVADPQNGTGAQTASTTYDFYTGLPLTSTDLNGNTSSINYTNNLLGTADPLGRPGTVYSPYVTIDGVSKRRAVKTYYEDSARKTRVESDLFNEGDALVKVRENRDQLGRIVLTERNENGASSYTVSAQTVYKVQDRVVMSSNPGRSVADSTDGWTRVTSDIAGRVIETATFSGASQPPVSGTNGNWTGSITTSYAANTTTVTDQSGKSRRSAIDGLGRLVRMDEPNDAGQLDVSGSPVQSTFYTYDVLGNLTQVAQGAQTRTFQYDSLSRLKEASHPEAGVVKYTYDLNNNLQTRRDARGIKTVYDYDAFNRVIKKCYRVVGAGALGMTTCTNNNETAEPNTADVAYTYENANIAYSKGKLTKVTNGFSTTEYTELDNLGRTKKSRQTTDGIAYNEMTYTYNLSGALTEQTYPSGRTVKNVLDNNGALAIVQSKKNSAYGYWDYADNFIYTAGGAVKSVQLGNGRWESMQLNSRSQVVQIGLGTTQNTSNLLKLDYSYGTTQNNGNIVSQTITVPTLGPNAGFTATQSYTYDSINRVKDAIETISGSQSWKQTFTYDRYGNRNFDEANTTTLRKNCTQNGVPAVCASDRKAFNPSIAAASNRIVQDQDNDSVNDYIYDSSGNVTKDADGQTFVYNGENKQVEVRNSGNQTVGQYFYDAEGQRVKKYVPATNETTIFIYNLVGQLVAEYSTQTSQTPQVSYLTLDNLGTPRVNTDEKGNVISRHDYHPFGEEVWTAHRTQGLNYTADSVRKKFTGYERDGESGLEFAQARYYSSRLGRFTSVDPTMESISGTTPQTWNRYIYVTNNPLRYTDPLGLWRYEIIYEYYEEGEKKGQVKSARLIFIAEKGDTAESLVKQLGYTEKDGKKYQEVLAQVKALLGDTPVEENKTQIEAAGIAGKKGEVEKIGKFFAQVNILLAAQKEWERKNPQSKIGPPQEGFNDCSMTSSRLAYPSQMQMRGAGGSGAFANFGIDEADEMNGRTPKAPLDSLRVRDIIRYGREEKTHFVNVLFVGTDGTALAFSRSGIQGRFEILKVNDKGLEKSYGKITGSYRP